jgi:hypothetical protein
MISVHGVEHANTIMPFFSYGFRIHRNSGLSTPSCRLTHSLTHLAEPIIVHDLHEFLGLVAQLEIFQFKNARANLIFLVKNYVRCVSVVTLTFCVLFGRKYHGPWATLGTTTVDRCV